LGGPYDITTNMLVVKLSDDANEFVIADAVRIEPVKFPTKVGEEFVIDDWDNKITEPDTGFNYFGGNTGATEAAKGTTSTAVKPESNGSLGGSLEISYEFKAGPIDPVPKIIDDGAPGFSTSGSWQVSTNQGFKRDVRYSAAGIGSDTARWTFTVMPGSYRVSATWTPHANRATDAPFTIGDGADSPATVKINQERAPDDFTDEGVAWEDLGAPYNIDTNTLVVELSDAANEYVVADAVRIVQVEPFAGYFASLFSLTDTLVSLNGQVPNQPTPFPNYYLDLGDIYRGSLFRPNRSVEQLRFDIRRTSSQDNQPITLKIELTDENSTGVFTRRTIAGDQWEQIVLTLPKGADKGDFTKGNITTFDPRRVSVLSLIVERRHVVDNVTNPSKGAFLVDNLALVDTDGRHPDVNAAADGNGNLRSQFTDGFLDLVRALSFQYFIDSASTDPRTGGIIQDRSTFADLMTNGGAGFQLTSYVIGAERGYISRSDAAARVQRILKVLSNADGQHTQGPGRVGTTGYQGFFYHFLGIDGLRKQNFNRPSDPGAIDEIDESLNTVELSTIDTALALAGVLTARQYFNGQSQIETEIRRMADKIYSTVNWRFMLYQNPDDPNDPQNNQFFHAWKPNEPRSGPRYMIDDAQHLGQYSSKLVDGGERPQTLDFYTDEALLVALLAISSGQVGREVWDAIVRDDKGGTFVKTFPGALFTYQFFSLWNDTEELGTDNHAAKPVNFFENTRAAIEATRDYAIANPNDRATWQDGHGATRWGLSAAEGPLDGYFAYAAPPAALAMPGIQLEGEAGVGDGSKMFRGNASGGQTVLLQANETRTLSFELLVDGAIPVSVRYSNDNHNLRPLETVQVNIDGVQVGSFMAQDTGDDGFGWNVFTNDLVGPVSLAAGCHQLAIAVSGGDENGVEIDTVTVSLPLEDGTVTNYAVGSSIAHTPSIAIEALWSAAHKEDFNEDNVPELLHPRFGFADAYNSDVANAAVSGLVNCQKPAVLRSTGPWVNQTGFAIDHGPMLIMIDNYLANHFVPNLFMSASPIQNALMMLFPQWTPPRQIIDDRDDGFQTMGTWSVATNQGYQQDVRYTTSGTGQDKATWTFDVTPGQYRVSVTWTPHSNRATNAPYMVLDGDDPIITVRINQEQSPNDRTDAGVSWKDLGPFNITSNVLSVNLSDDANEYVIADAVRIERVG
jgi:hypothetical protein